MNLENLTLGDLFKSSLVSRGDVGRLYVSDGDGEPTRIDVESGYRLERCFDGYLVDDIRPCVVVDYVDDANGRAAFRAKFEVRIFRDKERDYLTELGRVADELKNHGRVTTRNCEVAMKYADGDNGAWAFDVKNNGDGSWTISAAARE